MARDWRNLLVSLLPPLDKFAICSPPSGATPSKYSSMFLIHDNSCKATRGLSNPSVLSDTSCVILSMSLLGRLCEYSISMSFMSNKYFAPSRPPYVSMKSKVMPITSLNADEKKRSFSLARSRKPFNFNFNAGSLEFWANSAELKFGTREIMSIWSLMSSTNRCKSVWSNAFCKNRASAFSPSNAKTRWFFNMLVKFSCSSSLPIRTFFNIKTYLTISSTF